MTAAPILSMCSVPAVPTLVCVLLVVVILATTTITTTCAHDDSSAFMHGRIVDCALDAEDMDGESGRALHAELQQLRRHTFFKLVKVNLQSDCPFWQDSGTCAKRSCSVCECEQDSIPFPWRVAQSAPVDRSVDPTQTNKWDDEDGDEVWIAQDDAQRMTFVDLNLNADGYTGFSGAEAHRIWSAIYTENCFNAGPVDNMCREERVFYRLMSGLHTCITAHTANSFWASERVRDRSVDDPHQPPMATSLDAIGGADGLSREQSMKFQQFVLSNLVAFPDRAQNLYFTYVFLLRAVRKASNVLLSYDFHSGDAEADRTVAGEFRGLMENRLVRSCSAARSFDEESMFVDPTMRRQFRRKFVNISKIMDCVGCEKCRLHGKLQTLGIGTALKILFSLRSNGNNNGHGHGHGSGGGGGGSNGAHSIPLFAGGADIRPGDLELTRNEVVALIVTLAKFSHAIELIRAMKTLHNPPPPPPPPTTTTTREGAAAATATVTDTHPGSMANDGIPGMAPTTIVSLALMVAMLAVAVAVWSSCSGSRRNQRRRRRQTPTQRRSSSKHDK